MDQEIIKRLDVLTEKIIKMEQTFNQDIECQQKKHDMLDQKLSILITRFESINTVETFLTSVVSNLACVQENMEEVVRKVDRMETSLNETLKHGQDEVKKSLDDFITEAKIDMLKLNKDVKNSLNDLETTIKADVSAAKEVVVETISFVKTYYGNDTLKDSLESDTSKITTKFDESTKNIMNYIDITKHEIFAMTEKEAQIVRDRIEGPLPSHGTYTFDLYVLDFKSLIRSDKSVRSLPWYLNEIKSCVRGYVYFTKDGNISFWVDYGRRPLCVGLQLVTSNKRLKVKVTICDIYNKTLPDLEVGERTWTFDETGISVHINQGWGMLYLGSKSCDDLLQNGYGDKEGYRHGAVLIRYDVTLL